MQILEYEGNNNYIIGLAENDGQKMIFFAKVDSILLNSKLEEQDCYFGTVKIGLASFKKYIIELLLKKSEDDSVIHLIEIKNEDEYKIVCKFLRFIL